MALGLFGGIVFGIFGQVALVTRFGDGGGGSGTLDSDEMAQFVFKFLKAFFAIIIYFRQPFLILSYVSRLARI